MKRRWLAGLTLAAMVAAACGSEGGGTTTPTGGGGGCLDSSAASDLLEQATYAIVLQVRVGEEGGEPVYRNTFVGTAWAVGDRRLMTNAHVAEVPLSIPGVRVVGVRAGTGEVVTILSAYVHPDYGGTFSPDVALLTTQEALPGTPLPLAEAEGLELSSRQEVLLTGFPGDVESIFAVRPGEAVPQASASSGQITALRNFDDAVVVEAGNVDIIQHSAITTGGNSGSALFSCDRVIGIHNAGISFDVLAQGEGGQVTIQRVSGTNRFGIHVKHIHDLLALVDAGSLEGVSVQGTGALDACPDPSTYLDRVAAATYLVGQEVIVGQDQAGNPKTAFIPIGTAFAVDRRTLVTNAHVTEATKRMPLRSTRVLAVQSGTGQVVKLLRGITHPSYNGNPLGSPDVGLFTSEQALPSVLTLENPSAVRLTRGDAISVTGFPGDVIDFVPVVPGETIPQATSLSGTVTALRSYSLAAEVTPANTDMIQHQAPTTPGTSGSALIHCGRVVGTNNAGTVQIIVTIDRATGQFKLDRTAAASNNFAVHVRYIFELLDIFFSQAVQGFELPPPPAAGAGGPGGGQSGSGFDEMVGSWQGRVDAAEARHQFAFTVAPDGTVTGSSTWPSGTLTLTGRVAADGTIELRDDAAERLGFRTGNYQGSFGPDGSFRGVYFETTRESLRWDWVAERG